MYTKAVPFFFFLTFKATILAAILSLAQSAFRSQPHDDYCQRQEQEWSKSSGFHKYLHGRVVVLTS